MRAESPSISIILCVLNGERFLRSQLESFERQTFGNWHLLAADDGSTDESLSILREFRERLGPDRVRIDSGPSRGFAVNFLSLVCQPTPNADYYAFSDQDDVWENDKLERAVAWLSSIPRDTPAVYGSRTSLIDADGHMVGASPLFRKPPTFANALVQNIAGGNTMVFNEAARQLLIKGGGAVEVASHDWWLYLLTTANGGIVHYDPYCSVRYRRHEHNLVGRNTGPVARLRRARMLLEGRFRTWTDQHIRALQRYRPHMSPMNRATFDRFCKARTQGLIARIRGVRRSGVYRQTVLGTIGLLIGVMINRI